MASRLESPPPNPWLAWLQLGLSTMLAVLFLVILARSREQHLQLRQLQMRIQSLENIRTMEQAADQGSQLRVFNQRIADLESLMAERFERSEAERLRLQQLLNDLRGRMRHSDPGIQSEAADTPERTTP